MRLLKSFAIGVIALLLIVLGGLFALYNQTQVPLDLIWITLPSASIALWLMLSLAIGVIVGLLSMSGHCLRLRRHLARARQELAGQAATSPRSATPSQGT